MALMMVLLVTSGIVVEPKESSANKQRSSRISTSNLRCRRRRFTIDRSLEPRMGRSANNLIEEGPRQFHECYGSNNREVCQESDAAKKATVWNRSVVLRHANPGSEGGDSNSRRNRNAHGKK